MRKSDRFNLEWNYQLDCNEKSSEFEKLEFRRLIRRSAC